MDWGTRTLLGWFIPDAEARREFRGSRHFRPIKQSFTVTLPD
jgi:hypothetical protein